MGGGAIEPTSPEAEHAIEKQLEIQHQVEAAEERSFKSDGGGDKGAAMQAGARR